MCVDGSRVEPSKGGLWPKEGISSACDRLRPLATVGTPTEVFCISVEQLGLSHCGVSFTPGPRHRFPTPPSILGGMKYIGNVV